jgi:hypothetical protein
MLVLLPNQEEVPVWDLQNPKAWILIAMVIMKEKKMKGVVLLVLETNDSIPNIESVKQLLKL